MEKIHIGLYGGKSIFGGKEVRLRSETVYCDNHERCSLFEKEQCLNVTAPFSFRCKYGKVVVEHGVTSRSSRYVNFKREIETDDKYERLSHPSSYRICICGDYLCIRGTYVTIEKSGDKYIVNSSPQFIRSPSWVELDKFTADLLKEICLAEPYAIMGGKIEAYAKEVVPEILYDVKKLLPSIYEKFISENSEYSTTPNPKFIGKLALIRSMTVGSKLIDTKGNAFIFDGSYLSCKTWKSVFVPFSGGEAEVKIKVTDKMKYAITSNDQVNEHTIFI